MNIFEIGPYWVVANEGRQAHQFLIDEGYEIDNEFVNILSEDDLNRLEYYDDMDRPDESEKRTFKEQLDIMTARSNFSFPDLFAVSFEVY